MRRWPRNSLTRLHRWLGIGALGFVLILTVTGIVLNHSVELSLDRRYVDSPALLSWYGIEAPPPSASFVADGHWVVLLGERLYFDTVELAAGVSGLIGALAMPRHVVIATPTRILLASPDGGLIEQIPIAGLLPGRLESLGRVEETLVYRAGETTFISDADVLNFEPLYARGAVINWVETARPDANHLETLRRLYRGRGLSLERLLLDLHSGRIFSRSGAWLLDIVGVALIALSLIGFALWLRRHGGRHPKSHR